MIQQDKLLELQNKFSLDSFQFGKANMITKKIFSKPSKSITDSNYCSCSCYYSLSSDMCDVEQVQTCLNDVFVNAVDHESAQIPLLDENSLCCTNNGLNEIPIAKTNKKPEKYKTEMCRNFEWKGFCNYGDKCQYAHGSDELLPSHKHPKYKTKLCAYYHTKGVCDYGRRCNFIHDEKVYTTRNRVLSDSNCHNIAGVKSFHNATQRLQLVIFGNQDVY
ncbi:hypothetical protein MXB_430, partial [Myxobolus squamalis]